MTGGSVSFDRAADYYDATRSLPADQMQLLVSRLLAHLPPRALCLEIGIGTGRVGVPLRSKGIRVVGVDISAEMLGKLREKDGTLPVAIADATRLPFADRTFGAAVAAHVFHLIPGWSTAVDELLRVVAPGGVILASRAAGIRSEWQRAVRRHFYAEAGNPPWPPGMDTIEELDADMRSRGAAVREIEDVTSEGSSTISALLSALDKGIWSACWFIDEETRDRAVKATREWARRDFGDLDAPRPTSHGSDWRAYVLP